MIDWPVERLGMRAGLWLVVVALAQPAAAETLIVAADGSGDHIAIQPAITAAAPGDTIFIRNGIYDHHEWFITPYGAWNTYVALKKSPLTFIGESRDGVIIGPETAEFDGYDPKAFASYEDVTVSVRSLTIRNVREGWNALGDIQISDVAIDSCYVGIGVLANPRLIVKQASFSRCEIGVLTAGGSSTATIEDCEFDSGGGGIVNLNSGPVTIARCRFTAMESAIDVEQFSRADISDVVALGIETVGLAVYGGARVTATRCTFGPTKLGISVSSAKLVLTNSKVSAGWNYTFMLSSTDSLVVRGCDILVDPSNQKSIWASAYDLDPYPVLDMRDNYWGLTDSLAIENAIWHDVDDPEIKARVRFSPFRTQSTPSKAASLGRLKARY